MLHTDFEQIIAEIFAGLFLEKTAAISRIKEYLFRCVLQRNIFRKVLIDKLNQLINHQIIRFLIVGGNLIHNIGEALLSCRINFSMTGGFGKRMITDRLRSKPDIQIGIKLVYDDFKNVKGVLSKLFIFTRVAVQ